MEKSSVAIFLAIILGGSGLLFGYQAYSNTNISGIHRTKFTEDSQTELSEQINNNIFVEFEEVRTRIYVENGESVYVLFTTSIGIKDWDGPASAEIGNVYFVMGIDGVANISKSIHLLEYEEQWVYMPVTLQGMFTGLSVGFHDISIHYCNRVEDSRVYQSRLLVQTLK